MRHQIARRGQEEEPVLMAPAPRRKHRDAFAELPEYRKIEAHRLVGEKLDIRDPFYRPHTGAAGPTAFIDGREVLNFASYNYLGLNGHPEVIAQAKAALDRYAVSASASRMVGGERPVHLELEERIAGLYGTQAALVFVSGYLTNVAVISCLVGPEDLVVHDEFIHNSAFAGMKLSGATRRFFRHNDLADLRRILETAGRSARRVLVVVEGLYSMDGDLCDLAGLVALREEFGFWLMVDEAHALGVLGARGHGSAEHHGCRPDDVDIWMGTLSKTSSSCGGYIAGSSALVAILKAYAGGFVYSAGLPPVLAAAAATSLGLMQADPARTRRLKENGRFFLDAAGKAGLKTGLSEGYSVVPVMVGDSVKAAKLSDLLLENDINVLPIIYPAVPEGLARLRFFITSEHTPEQLATAVRVTAACLKQADGFGVNMIDINVIAGQLG